jgi:glycerol transport system ATP-binding protein
MGIELRHVSKQVGAETHIYETDLTLEKGGFNVLLGTTQSGKTTLMRLMAGLERPSSGEVWFDGEDVTGVPVRKRSVAMVYQAFVNYPNFSVFDNIASPLRVARRPPAEIKQRVEKISELLKLESMLERYPGELSGGSAPRSPALWSRTLGSCFWMSRLQTSITSCAKNCATSCQSSSQTPAPR